MQRTTSPSVGSRITRFTMRRRGLSSSVFFPCAVRAGPERQSSSRTIARPMADLLTVRDLKVSISVDAGVIKAVDGVSFRIPAGGTVALVGESGSGKSVIAQSIMGILPKIARIDSGEIVFRDPRSPGEEIDLSRVRGPAMRRIRGGRISIIFQEPMTALSPLHTIGNQIGEALLLHRSDLGKTERRAAVIEMLRLAGFPDPAKAENTYFFELSGGLRQRAMIAMALVSRPALLIADEPTTALDVTIQAQILQLIQQLQGELGMAVLLITHDLGVVANMAEEVVVMHRGRVMEAGTLRDIFRDAQHPYLKALMRAVPRFNMAPGERLTPIREVQMTDEHLIATRATYTPRQQGTLLQVENLTKRYRIRKRVAGRARDPALGHPGRGRHHLQRSWRAEGCPGAQGRRALCLPAQGAVRVPGSVQLAQPAYDGLRHRQRAARHPQDR